MEKEKVLITSFFCFCGGFQVQRKRILLCNVDCKQNRAFKQVLQSLASQTTTVTRLLIYFFTVMSICRLHIIVCMYINGSSKRRHFHRNKFIFKMSISVPFSPIKLFRFVRHCFEQKLPKICDFGLCRRVTK